MTTAHRVFDLAMGLMDEVNENSGATDTADTKGYKQRTLFILNTLRGELYPLSDTYKNADKGKRPVCDAITDFDTGIGLDDVICQSIMPYGLAAHLLLDENPDAAAFFQQRYDELKQKIGAAPAELESITDVYGVSNEYGESSRW